VLLCFARSKNAVRRKNYKQISPKEAVKMPVTIEINGDTMVARLSGELDHHHTQKLREEIDRNVQKERPARLALDFAGVEFMDSSGIGLVLGRYRLMQEMNGKLVLRAMPPHIRRVMRVAGIASLEIEEESRV
jgi:stage II sporulation protein AA (anti-sigma F factor antagonist)